MLHEHTKNTHPWEDRPLKVQFAPADEGGTSYHWCHLPSKVINDSGLGEAIVDRRFRMDQDVLIIQRQINTKILGGIEMVQQSGATVLYWIEDHVWLLPFTSPVRKEYSPANQAKMFKIIKECDGVLCSSKPLKTFLSNYHDNIYVLPHIMLKKWSKIFKPKTKRIDDEVRIIWTTTAHHKHDFTVIEHVMKTIMDKYKNVRMILWGFATERMVDMLPKDRLELYGWVPVDYYYRILASMEADIGVAPLEDDSAYNNAKTPLKFLEYGLMGTCPVVSNVRPYDCVIDGETGVVPRKNKHKFWVDAISELVEDKEKRQRISKNAQKWVIENHTEDRIVDYLDAYKDAMEKKRAKDGKKE